MVSLLALVPPLLRRRPAAVLLAILLFVAPAMLLMFLQPMVAMPTTTTAMRDAAADLWQGDWRPWAVGVVVPMRRYHSLEHDSVDLRFAVRDESACSRELLFLATRGSETEPGAVILDHTGELVWRQPRFAAEVHDFRPQTYRGRRFLTFWAGGPGAGRKIGFWYMMDDSYTIRYNISAPGFTYGDMHEFTITSQGTALLTIYDPVRGDLSAVGGPSDGWFLDGVFQEIDLETRKVLFQWRASDHIPLNATRRPLHGCTDDPAKAFLGCGNTTDAAFDYYHINSVQKDKKGNYLVSGRHTSSLTYIDGRSGRPLWHMGGQQNQFRFLPLGTNLLFAWQHDARLHYHHHQAAGAAAGDENEVSITLLDNNAYDPHANPRTESRGLRVRADLKRMTASVAATFRPPLPIMAFSQGNLQMLDPDPGNANSSNVLVGWGSSPAWTEFSPAGDVLCHARFAPPAPDPSRQTISSYRTHRGAWIGRPAHPPRVVATRHAVYVSWNGATEVSSWRLQGTTTVAAGHENKDEKFELIAEIPKTRFETGFPRANITKPHSRIRVVAVDVGGHALGTSLAVPLPPSSMSSSVGDVLSNLSGWSGIGVLVLVLGVGVVGVALCRRRRGSSIRYEPVEMNEL